VTLSLIHDNGDAQPRQFNDKIHEINEISDFLAFCSAIDAVDVEMSKERVN
jgi:hypothetical protein